MGKRLLALSLLALLVIRISAQESYSNDVTCLKADSKIAIITASGQTEKKKEAYDMALKSIFNALFVNGVEGVGDGKPLLSKKNTYYVDQFFKSRYMLFIKSYEPNGEPQKTRSKLYHGTVTAQVMIEVLIRDLVQNEMMENPLDRISMEETQQQIALPTIMVIPFKKDGRTSYASILKNDFDLRMAVSTVKNGFIQLGVKTISAEGKLNATLRASEWEAKNADSNDRQLLQNSGADVYVIVDLKKDISPAQGSRVSLIMTARETATGSDLASRQGWTNRFRTTDLDKLCTYATQDILDEFLKDISKEFARKIKAGNTTVLRIGLADDAVNTLNSRVGGNLSISAQIRNWVKKNAQEGRYHIQGSVDDSLIFDSVQIPTKDKDGIPMDASTFADNLALFLDELGVSCDVRIDGNTIYITLH